MTDIAKELSHDMAELPIWGARAIGRVIGKKPTETFYLLKSGQLPATKIGDSWVAYPSRLRARLRGEVVS
jgi:hypothetical protein